MTEGISSSLAQLRLSGHEGVKQQGKVGCSRHCLWGKQNEALRIQHGFQLRCKSILWSTSSTRPAGLRNRGQHGRFSELSHPSTEQFSTMRTRPTHPRAPHTLMKAKQRGKRYDEIPHALLSAVVGSLCQLGIEHTPTPVELRLWLFCAVFGAFLHVNYWQAAPWFWRQLHPSHRVLLLGLPLRYIHHATVYA